MSILDRILRRPEKRSSEDPSFLLSDSGLLGLFGLGGSTEVGISVNENNAMGVSAFAAAVNVMAGTLASLPLHVYRRKRDGSQERVKTGIALVLSSAVNDEASSFEWRKFIFTRTFTGGRSLTYIERDANGKTINLFPFPAVKPEHDAAGRKFYRAKTTRGKDKIYYASDVIDVPFMVRSDGVSHVGPIEILKEVIALAIASKQYGAKVFKKGGIPPLALQGPFKSPAGIQRAADDVVAAIAKAYEGGRPALALPIGHELKPLGFNPEQMQMLELQRFLVEEIARVFSMPPTFLQDLTNGTHSNTEQQDLHFVKHTLRPWIEQVEQELNLKLFGRSSNSLFVKFNLEGLLRGDFKTRMEGYSAGVQAGVVTPNEARALENREPIDGGDEGYIQGANLPLKTQKDATLNKGSADGGSG